MAEFCRTDAGQYCRGETLLRLVRRRAFDLVRAGRGKRCIKIACKTAGWNTKLFTEILDAHTRRPELRGRAVAIARVDVSIGMVALFNRIYRSITSIFWIGARSGGSCGRRL